VERKCQNESIELGVLFESNEQTGKVRLVWSVKNVGAKRIRIQSYYCPFYERDNSKGVYVNGKWVTEERYIASRRIQTELYPEEFRTFVWSFVEPIYYGLTTEGPWSYHLRLLYSIEDGYEAKFVECESNPFKGTSSKMPQQLGDITSPQIIDAICRRFPGARDSSHARNLEDELLKPSGKAQRMPDAILEWDGRVLLVLLKAFGLLDDVTLLQNMRKNLQKKADQLELRIEGVIVAFEPDKSLSSDVRKVQGMHLIIVNESNPDCAE